MRLISMALVFGLCSGSYNELSKLYRYLINLQPNFFEDRYTPEFHKREN